MANSEDLIDFDVIESHKENIQALPSGRSAKALAQLYSPPLLSAHASPAAVPDEHSQQRAEFEKELHNTDEADDPLDVYERYVRWTLDTYPSAQATPQSQLLPLLERATKAFQSSSHYKDDPRYLKLWLHYIHLFSDAPREVFIFLSRQGIGENLALYYEEFAAWLENAGRWNQAEEVYKLGLEKEVRPAERLLRKFGEFERRKDARSQDAAEPTSPALPVVRPALAAKIDPFATSSHSPTQQSQSRSSASKKPKGSKMQIFSDSVDGSHVAAGGDSKGWTNIGSLADRKKENSMEAKPWAGEKLKGGKTNGAAQKIMVFKDKSSEPTSSPSLPSHIQRSLSSNAHTQQCVLNPKTGRMDCVFVNLEAVYPELPSTAQEFCFEELRAKHRGLAEKKWPRQRHASRTTTSQHLGMPEDDQRQDLRPKGDSKAHQQQPNPKRRGFEIFEDAPLDHTSKTQAMREDRVLVGKISTSLTLNDGNDENAPPSTQDANLAKKIRREERANRTRRIKVMDVRHVNNETKTIQLNLDSPVGPKLRRKKSIEKPEPTMTINTKEAIDEIYGIFNQPLPSQAEQMNDNDAETDDDYTTGDESTATGKLSGTTSEYGEETRNELLGVQSAGEKDSRTEASAWSDFTSNDNIQADSFGPTTEASAQSTGLEIYEESSLSKNLNADSEELSTPGGETPATHILSIPPDDYEMQTRQAVIPNHRLPFMTPIVERTESSLGAVTARTERDCLSAKTPSRGPGLAPSHPDDDELLSSPFDETLGENAEEKRKVLQPIRTKSTKGTLSLGHGTAKSQFAARFKPSLSVEPLQKGPFVQDEQCNPMDPHLRQAILAQMQPPLTTYEGYFESRDKASGRTSEIRKFVKTMAKASRSSVNLDKTAQTLALPPTLSFHGADGQYSIKRELGAGTFAPVYLVENSVAVMREDAEGNDDDRPSSRMGKSAHRKPMEALKMEDPPSTWEFYIIRQAHRRLGVSRPADSILRAHEMHLFRDECFLIEEFRDQGTLLDLVNLARIENGAGGAMDEMLAMWLTVELLRTVEALHIKQIIHGDLKGDNVLVRFDDPGSETDWSPTYFPSGAHGWASKGICLIDFGRGIDMKAFVPNVAFIADWKTTDADCAEMRELRPWTYQIDYHGLAGIIHSLLFGKYMETVGEKSGALGQGSTKTYRIRESFKRYWQTEIWSEVFSLLLNPLAHVEAEDGKVMPVVRSMRNCRERMEGWLETNCERGVGLKGMIARMEVAIREKRRKSIK